MNTGLFLVYNVLPLKMVTKLLNLNYSRQYKRAQNLP